jgi:long-chain acyl-CoA synthetase
MTVTLDMLSPEQAVTLPGLFVERVRRTPLACAYRRFDLDDRCCSDISWQEAHAMAGRWQQALRNECLAPGDRVAIMVRNGLDWIGFDLAALGGRIRLAISGGAPLSPQIARIFLAFGVPVLQGYGLTETSPVVAVNRLDDNRPQTVGPPLPGVEVKLSARDELLVRAPSVMQGYWQNAAATAGVIDREGWFHTGDLARLEPGGHISITGRSKEIIVLSNGEKIPLADMEQAIAGDHLFDQVMVVGEGRPFLTALVVLNQPIWHKLASARCLETTGEKELSTLCEQELLQRLAARLKTFPGYAQVKRVLVCQQPWEVADGLLTATLKLRRPQIEARFEREIAEIYAGY